jgi:predicted nucleotidyltransferase component of viral defense system
MVNLTKIPLFWNRIIDGTTKRTIIFDYPWISPPILAESLILAGDKDIAAMKISAITGRGSKKDFYDLHELLKRYTLKNIMEWYSLKYIDGSQYLALKSLIYFEDAEEQEDPISLNDATWEQVKSSILREHAEYLMSL